MKVMKKEAYEYRSEYPHCYEVMDEILDWRYNAKRPLSFKTLSQEEQHTLLGAYLKDMGRDWLDALNDPMALYSLQELIAMAIAKEDPTTTTLNLLHSALSKTVKFNAEILLTKMFDAMHEERADKNNNEPSYRQMGEEEGRWFDRQRL